MDHLPSELIVLELDGSVQGDGYGSKMSYNRWGKKNTQMHVLFFVCYLLSISDLCSVFLMKESKNHNV